MNCTRDVRGGWPSASSMENLSLCPGSFSAQKDIKEEQMSFDAMAGTRIHSYLEGVQDMVLNVQEQDIADELEMKRETVIAELFPKPGKKPPTVMKEHRLWLSPPAMAAPINFSGMADHILIHGTTALIVDYKTGRGEVTPSSRNLQLLALAVLLKENFPKLRKVHTAILQTREDVEVATFTTKQLREGKQLLLSILELAAPWVQSKEPIEARHSLGYLYANHSRHLPHLRLGQINFDFQHFRNVFHGGTQLPIAGVG